MPHVAWLKARLADGSLLASGPFEAQAGKSALLIISAPSREAVDASIADDPFAIEGVIANMVVREWNPIFGAFNRHSTMPSA